MRETTVERKTKETHIRLHLNLDGGEVSVETGVGFFDHMLTAFAVHGGFGLELACQGDLQVDCHHTVEDTGIVLGGEGKLPFGFINHKHAVKVGFGFYQAGLDGIAQPVLGGLVNHIEWLMRCHVGERLAVGTSGGKA